MSIFIKGLKEVELSGEVSFEKNLADCVILTHDNKLLMQQRPLDWGSSAGCLTTFGGHVESGESVERGLIRELGEELGAKLDPSELVFVGTLTEEFTGHTEAVHIYFWHDKKATITGCYEAEDRRYDSAKEALAHPKIMDYARWALMSCEQKGLLKPLCPHAGGQAPRLK